MKKLLVLTMMFFVFAVGLPLTVEGQSNCHRYRKKSYASRNYRRSNTRYATRGYYTDRRLPSFYRRHRNVIKMAIGTGAGALLGGLIGGGRGASGRRPCGPWRLSSLYLQT